VSKLASSVPNADLPVLTLPPVPPDEAGARLDRHLSQQLPTRFPEAATWSRSRLKALIQEGRVRLQEQLITDPSRKIKPGEVYAVSVPAAVSAVPEAEDMPLTVVYEDSDLIVIDKPAGLVVHPAPGNPEHTLVNALLHHCGDSLSGIGGVRRPGIVHRIDKDTSGLVVAAKTEAAHHGLAGLFARHDIERAYLALVQGLPNPTSGRIEGAIGRDPRDRKRMAILEHGGRAAVTHYALQQVFRDQKGAPFASLLRCELETGRTHQIRVHLAARGHGLIGDPLYGRGRPGRAIALAEPAAAALKAFGRQALHACLLGFRHPVSGQMLRFESPLPPDFAHLVTQLGGDPQVILKKGRK